MLKKTCLAAFSLSLFVPLANATAYTDKVAEMQAKYELAVKEDKAKPAACMRKTSLLIRRSTAGLWNGRCTCPTN